jgi:hypothetical protein
MLGFKQALQIAVDEEYEYVSWSPGEVVQDRYSLASQVDEISVEVEDGIRQVTLITKEQGEPRLDVNEAGTVIKGMTGTEGKQLDEVVGKEVAQKIMAMEFPYEAKREQVQEIIKRQKEISKMIVAEDTAENIALEKEFDELSEKKNELQDDIATNESPNVLTTEDLKIGGEWATRLYDKYLPREVAKYIKKLDKNAKVEVKEVETEAGLSSFPRARFIGDILNHLNDGNEVMVQNTEGEWIGVEDIEEVEEDYGAELDEAYEEGTDLTPHDFIPIREGDVYVLVPEGEKAEVWDKTQSIWAVKITDEIEDAIADGQSLYQTRENIKPEFSNPDWLGSTSRWRWKRQRGM